MHSRSSEMVRVAVIGANGGIGRRVVEQSLLQGYFVRAVVRNPASFTLTHPNLDVRIGDVMDIESLNALLGGMDAVISTIGKSSVKETVLYSRGNENVIKAMEVSDVRRVFFISASGIEVNPTHSLIVRLATRFILQKVLKHMYADLERMEAMIKRSALDWTIMRPPRLTDNAVTGRYRISVNQYLENPWAISRADLAHYIVNQMTNEEIFRSTVELSD